ncbi:MarR family winged helix-turn-helix transcriptional regulator [Emcibacter nanhaiensis]|uniref:MarR family transcriptional regulator n=1 Tax=Emcibacter nanhaiensis TaxID=1505037 RepID=A0A501PIA4_9PROT|nr:MarR family transcriptional regulator [Emcibacter nanhaiensis]TPD60200.1 MarR family transcriptional regulator [Emcibacter nanhaiensis]
MNNEHSPALNNEEDSVSEELKSELLKFERDNYNKYYVDGSIDDILFKFTRAMVFSSRKWRKHLDEKLRSIDQSQARWETLFVLSFSNSNISQRELAKMISIEAPTMVRMLDKLAKDGLIERIPDKNDKRLVINKITKKGLEVVNELKELTDSFRMQILHEIPLREIEQGTLLLMRIARRLDKIKEVEGNNSE